VIDEQEEEWPVYAPVGRRLDGMGLHPSHHWTYFTHGDCWDGVHAGIQCSECEVEPYRLVCYHELRENPEANRRHLRDRGIAPDPAALVECPGGSE